MLVPAAAAPPAEPLPPDHDPSARTVIVRAPHATLRLRLATRVGEDLALHCAKELPSHGGMLVSVRPANGATLFSPRYQFAHVDEVALDEFGTVVAAVLDAPRFTGESGAAFVVRARYIIDVRAGEALADGLVPGAKVRIEADAATLVPERDRSRPPTPFCPLVLTVPSATPDAPGPSTPFPCFPPGPSARALPVSFEEGQFDVPVDAKSFVFYIESTVNGEVTLRSPNGVLGPVPLHAGVFPAYTRADDTARQQRVARLRDAGGGSAASEDRLCRHDRRLGVSRTVSEALRRDAAFPDALSLDAALSMRSMEVMFRRAGSSPLALLPRRSSSSRAV